jgi:hypothetical protein
MMWNDTLHQLEFRLSDFAKKIDGIGMSVSEWLDQEAIRGNLPHVDEWTTAHACKALASSTGLISGYVEILLDPKSHDEEDLEALVDAHRSSEWQLEKDFGIRPKEVASAAHSLQTLTDNIVQANTTIRRFLKSPGNKNISWGWVQEDDLWKITEDVPYMQNLIEEQFILLRGLIVDRLDPKFRDMAVLVSRIEELTKELRSKMAIRK